MPYPQENQLRLISLKQVKRLVIGLVIVLLFDFLLFPFPALAQQAEVIEIENNDYIIINHLPESGPGQVSWTGQYVITAYNSEAAQTDDTPCLTANGFDLCQHGQEDTVAANFLAFGTRIRIPELYGDKVFIVRDRMNKRYDNRLDIWMLNKQEAKQFGVKIAVIEVLE